MERDYRTIAALFEDHHYPPPHRMACHLHSDPSAGTSIRTVHDMKVPVIVRKHTGEIVDGINRCERLCEKGVPWKDVPKRIVDLPTDDDVAECIAKCNFDRRHLDKSQMAMLAVQLGLGKPRQGERTDIRKNCRRLVSVSAKYLQHARTVEASGSEELISAVVGGELSVADAAKIAETIPKEKVASIYRETRTGPQTFRTVAGNAYLAERSRLLAAECASFPNLVVPVCYLDPGWKFEVETNPFNPRNVMGHYPVMSAEEICNLPIRRLLAAHAWMFMWATVRHRHEAVAKVLPAFGCEFVDEIIWRKNLAGLGPVIRHQHEILLIARRGNPPFPPTDSRPPSVVQADVEEHSKKPDIFRDIIISMTPNLTPRLELFARGNPYPGFMAWGNEVTSRASIAA
jgi:N6-adenosine-specific RNA methylase IME4